MNLRSIANSITRTINPNTIVTVKSSTGYTINPATLEQVPAYSEATGEANIQALDGQELRHLFGMNIQGKIRAAYLYGELAGVIRPDGKGGDLVIFEGHEWLVVKVLEVWKDWCKVAIQYQGVAS